VALFAAKNFKLFERATRLALRTGAGFNRIFGVNTMLNITRTIRKIIPAIPLWSNYLQAPPDLSLSTATNTGLSDASDNAIVYFPACISRTMGTYRGQKKNLMETFISICRKSGIPVKVLDNAVGTCCSQIFSSKGFKDAQRHMANSIVDKLWASSSEGLYPVVTDVSSCAYTLHHILPALDDARKIKYKALTILDSVPSRLLAEENEN
jgi:D-lactate dehydrogenase